LCNKLYEKRDQMPPIQQAMINWANAWLYGTPNEEINYIKQSLEYDNQDPITIRNLGDKYFLLNQFSEAIPYLKNALEIYNKWGTKPIVFWNYTYLGTAYHNKRKYRLEEKLYKKAEQDFPDNYFIISRQAILSLTKKDTLAANRYIEKYISLRKGDTTVTEAAISTGVAGIYSEAGILNRAEKYYRQALSLSPKSTGAINYLAYFLIDKGLNIKEGLQLADTALKINPNSYTYLHTKGWGLYKQGKYQEAKDLLQISWDLRKKNSIYDHTAFAHLDSAKKAVAGLK
jgi:tetratricopeptide (TPR) repeat protein